MQRKHSLNVKHKQKSTMSNESNIKKNKIINVTNTNIVDLPLEIFLVQIAQYLDIFALMSLRQLNSLIYANAVMSDEIWKKKVDFVAKVDTRWSRSWERNFKLEEKFNPHYPKYPRQLFFHLNRINCIKFENIEEEKKEALKKMRALILDNNLELINEMLKEKGSLMGILPSQRVLIESAKKELKEYMFDQFKQEINYSQRVQLLLLGIRLNLTTDSFKEYALSLVNQDSYATDILEAACKDHAVASARLVLAQWGISVDRFAIDVKKSILTDAIDADNLELIRWMVSGDDNPLELCQVPRANKMAPLFYAAANGKIEIVKYLIFEIQVDADLIFDDNVPLFAAMAFGHVSVVDLLLGHTNINFNHRGLSALMSGVVNMQHACVARLLQDDRICLENQNYWDGTTPFAKAILNNDIKMCEILVKPYVNFYAKHNRVAELNECLIVAAKNGSDAIVELLYQHGVTINEKDIQAYPCLQKYSYLYCPEKMAEKIKTLLVDYSTNIAVKHFIKSINHALSKPLDDKNILKKIKQTVINFYYDMTISKSNSVRMFTGCSMLADLLEKFIKNELKLDVPHYINEFDPAKYPALVPLQIPTPKIGALKKL